MKSMYDELLSSPDGGLLGRKIMDDELDENEEGVKVPYGHRS